jgi:hypothetical protein
MTAYYIIQYTYNVRVPFTWCNLKKETSKKKKSFFWRQNNDTGKQYSKQQYLFQLFNNQIPPIQENISERLDIDPLGRKILDILCFILICFVLTWWS